jgi:hypothetical protein
MADPKTEDRLNVGVVTTDVLAPNNPLTLLINWLDVNTTPVALEMLLTKLDDCKPTNIVDVAIDDNVSDGEMTLDDTAALAVKVFTLSNVTDEDNTKDVAWTLRPLESDGAVIKTILPPGLSDAVKEDGIPVSVL